MRLPLVAYVRRIAGRLLLRLDCQLKLDFARRVLTAKQKSFLKVAILLGLLLFGLKVVSIVNIFLPVPWHWHFRPWDTHNGKVPAYYVSAHSDNRELFAPFLQKPSKVILAWTGMYQSDVWFGFDNEAQYAETLRDTGCVFTRDKAFLVNASLVIFHGCFQKRDDFKFPVYRSEQQRYVYLTTEAPTSRYCSNPFIPADEVFNVTATYKRDSDLLLSYAPLLRRRPSSVSSYNRAAGKSRLVFWYISDCSDWAANRSAYVKELQKHVPVDIFGTCFSRFPETRALCRKSDDDSMDRCFYRLSRKYKFYLAFENAICSDYVTEKFFKVLQPHADVVPVALGASLADYQALAPPSSFIHVSDFTSPKHLADYLKYLDSNDNAYNTYHDWRSLYYYERLPGRNSIDQHPPSQLLQLCLLAHDPPAPRSWDRLTTWFSVESDCRVVKDLCHAYGICKNRQPRSVA